MTRTSPLDEPPAAVVRDVLDQAIDAEIIGFTRVEEGLNGVYQVNGRRGGSWVMKLATLNEDAELRVEAHLIERIGQETDVPVPEIVRTMEPRSNDLHRDRWEASTRPGTARHW